MSIWKFIIQIRRVFWYSLLHKRSFVSMDAAPGDITVYPKKYAHGFCFAVLCCGYTLTDFPISIRLTSLALWQSNDCPSAGKATLMNMDKYFMWIYYERLHNHNKAKHNKTVCIFPGIYCMFWPNSCLISVSYMFFYGRMSLSDPFMGIPMTKLNTNLCLNRWHITYNLWCKNEWSL